MVVQTSDGSFSQKARNMRNNKIGWEIFRIFRNPGKKFTAHTKASRVVQAW